MGFEHTSYEVGASPRSCCVPSVWTPSSVHDSQRRQLHGRRVCCCPIHASAGHECDITPFPKAGACPLHSMWREPAQKHHLNNLLHDASAASNREGANCTLALRASQTFVYRGVTGRVIILGSDFRSLLFHFASDRVASSSSAVGSPQMR